MAKKFKKALAMLLAVLMMTSTMSMTVFAEGESSEQNWDEENKILTLNNAKLEEGISVSDGWTIVVNGDCSIDAGTGNGIASSGTLTITGEGKLTISGQYGIRGTSVSIENIEVDVDTTMVGIYTTNTAGNTTVTLSGVNGCIVGDYAGIYVYGNKAETKASVTIDGCELDITSEATAGTARAVKSGITVYVTAAEKVETSINIENSKVNAAGADAGLSINNYLGDADATNSASSRINITNSIVTANSINGTWAGLFASVLGQHPDADSIITITDSSVYAVSPNTGVLTSSQAGESKIILDNSILGASGKTALSMIEPSSQVQVAELKNGSTYVQMTPDAVMKGEITVFDGKTIIAVENEITYDYEDNYYIIPQGSVVTETFTNGTDNTYTFNGQAGGVGGFDYDKEEIWGFDVPESKAVCMIVETGVEYETLAAAVADANASAGADTIKMLKDIDFDKTLSIKGAVTIIGEYTITRGENFAGTFFTVPKGASLTLDGGLVIDGNNDWDMDMDLYNNHLETMAQQGISIYTTEYTKEEFTAYNTEKASQYFTPEAGAPIATDYMIKVTGAGTVNLKDVTIQNNYTPKSGLVNTSAGTVVNLDGAQIKHCASVEGSGTVVNASGKITINIEEGTLIDGNHVGGNHGLFRVYSGAVVNMSGGTLSNTTGWNSNGVVIGLYGTGSTFNMSGGLITGNSSVFGADNGRNAAVYLHANSTMNMTGGTISFNNGRARGGIDTYKETSTLNVNRADQVFVDGVYPNENGTDAYIASNHPMIVDNLSRANNSNYDVGTSGGNYLNWRITGGIYTQDVDEYCAEGYICIPYEDTERTDDYIVVPGYRVNYYSVEKIVTTDAETGAEVVDYQTTLENKYFHMLPRDKFWYEMDERAGYITVTNADGNVIDTWYTEKELVNVYDFDTKLESDLNLYGEWKAPAKEMTGDYIITYDRNEDSGKAYMLYVTTDGEVVDFIEMKGKHSPIIVYGKEDLISVVYIPKANTGWLWTSEEISDEVYDVIEATLDKNVSSYKEIGASATGLGEFALTKKKQTYTYNVDLYEAVVTPEVEAPVVETTAPAEPTLNVTVKGAEVSSWLVTGDGVTAVYIAADGKVPAVIWTSERVDDMATIIKELGADADATVVFGLGSHDIEYQHNKNKTKTVTYTFS